MNLKEKAGQLTNFEVLDFLRSRGASKDLTLVMSSLAPSEFKVHDYLVMSPACNQTRESISEFIEKCKEYQLAKAEVMNIINNRPSSAVEIAPMVEEWDSRMEDKICELVEMVEQVLPPGPTPPDQSDAEEPAEATDEKANDGEEQMEQD